MRTVKIISVRASESHQTVSTVTHIPSAQKLISTNRVSGSANYQAGQDYQIKAGH